MRRSQPPRGLLGDVPVVAPTLRRARQAIQALGGRWGRARLTAAILDDLAEDLRHPRVLLCPGGAGLSEDLAFLTRARERLLWPPADADLAAAIAGLRGGHSDPLPAVAEPAGDSDRKSALLLEGNVTGKRARAALSSGSRHWIVESVWTVRLTDRQFRALAKKGVRWSALEPVRVAALLASPRLARARREWRHLLPNRTRVRVVRTMVRG